ncbi:unnamed protein product [marine sediment metagenome]|uniref:Uncharacterized protein n=1 Tax=marine sediment metagenome TaxID=412755 RepID=X1K1A9_9ZZZZ
MDAEEKTVIEVTPDQVIDAGQELPDLEFTVNVDALDDLTIGQSAALLTPDKVPLYLLIEAIDALTDGVDVWALKKEDLELVAERIGEAFEVRRASKN